MHSLLGSGGFERLALCLSLVLVGPAPAQGDEPSTEELMRAARREHGRKAKRYAAMVEEVGEAVETALAERTWRGGPGEGEERPLSGHPLLAHLEVLRADALAMAEGRENPESTVEKLERHPWEEELEFLLGLAYGAERAVPDHDNGFIDLGRSPMPPPGWPDLLTNHYLHGLEEIVGWQYGVETGKRPSYRGRESDDRPVPAAELPPWEELRVLLEGCTPDAALFGVQRFTHLVHSRLAERRRQDAGEIPHMDDFLVMLDSKWNGFQFELPETGERVAFVQPVHWLFTNGEGFVFQFPRGESIAMAGDIPFFSIQTYTRFAELYLDRRMDPGDFIAANEEAREVRAAFVRERSHLSRYKALIDVFARAVLAPNLRYPTYLSSYDYPDGELPAAREIDYDLDMPRRHAIVVWAWSAKDPDVVADFLYDELLTREELRFPSKESLVVAFTLVVREKHDELLSAVGERITRERDGEAVLDTPGYAVGDYEREFSPYATYRTTEGEPSSAHLAHSFHAFHRPLVEGVRAAARAAVLEATGD